MHFVKAKGILGSHNGMNIYRGCTHGCIYCDSRSKCYNMPHEFEDIEVKENALVLLEQALKSKRKRCMIGTGSMSDPYMPIEKKLLYTRESLKLAEKYGFGMTVITKSDLVLRDMDLLKAINEKTKCVVQMTLTTYDEELCRIIEPNVASTARRFEVLSELKKQNIPTVVWLDPILPYINDTKENLLGILDYCIKASVKGIICFGMGLTLREGNREYFYQKLDEHFPGLKQKYIKEYGTSYEIMSPNNAELMKFFKQACRENGIMSRPKEVFAYLSEFEEKQDCEQISFF